MSVYLKLQQVREELSKMNLKKTGKNQGKYFYFELGDFLPAITSLCNKHKICCVIKFTEDLAELVVVDSEKPESTISFTSTIAEAKLNGGAQPIQNLGAIQTYLRRYLYMNCMEIVESDLIDAGEGEKPTPQKKVETPQKKEVKSNLSDAQLKRLFAISKANNKLPEEVSCIIKNEFKKESSKELTKAEYDKLINILEGK